MGSPAGQVRNRFIQVNSRTLTISEPPEAYQLHNIARISVFTWNPNFRSAFSVLRKLALSLFSAISTFTFTFAFPPLIFVSFMLFALTFYYVVQLIQILSRKRKFILLLESTGEPVFAVSSEYWDPIFNLYNSLVAAIDNPPDRPVVYSISHLSQVEGDQINVHGSNNTGKRVL